MDNQNQNQDKETATGTNLNANPSNTYVSPNVTNGLVNVNPIKPKGSKKKSLIIIAIIVTCISIFVVIPLVLAALLIFSFSKPGYEKAQEMVEANLSKNCSQSEMYYDGFAYSSGGEMSGTGYGWIGLCDNEIIIAGSPGKVLAAASDYSYYQDAFASDISPEVESAFPNSPYYFLSHGDNNMYHNLWIVLHGDTWYDVEKYRASFISLLDELKNIYDNDKDEISIDIYLTPDSSFNNNYYKAAMFAYTLGEGDGFDEEENVLNSNVNLLDRNIRISVSAGEDSSAAFEEAISHLYEYRHLN